MKIKEVLNVARENLIKSDMEDASIVSRQLLAYTLNKNIQYLVINMDKELEDCKCKIFNRYVQKVIEGYPPQYITNKQEFMGINFYVDENVLIPQPDTEIIVENVLNICAKMQKNIKKLAFENNKQIKILDLCTGSGAIAVSLKNNLNNVQIFASDISSDALNVAKKNSENNKAEITFINSDLFKNIKEKNFDVIVSNPPYIKTQVIETLSNQVKKEPILALDGGKDGLDMYKKIILEAPKYIKNNGFLCLEIGYDQKNEVIKLLKQANCYTEITAIKDLSNNDRCIVAKIIL